MTLPVRLYAVHLPSPTQSVWQIALVEAAAAAGWDVISLVTGQDPPVRDGIDALIQGTDANLIPADAPDAVILTGSPQTAVDTLMQLHGMDRKTALNSVAWWFAQAAEAAAAGVKVLDAAAESLVIPGLGHVARAEGRLVEPTTCGEPLAFYDTLPPRVGASAAWPMEILTWENADNPGQTDLTGKRRLIQHGPYLLLSAGTWTAEIVFELSINRAITELRFDWGDGTDVAVVSRRLTAPGVYSATLTNSWARATTTELRIWLDRSMFDGSIKVLSTTITRAA